MARLRWSFFVVRQSYDHHLRGDSNVLERHELTSQDVADKVVNDRFLAQRCWHERSTRKTRFDNVSLI